MDKEKGAFGVVEVAIGIVAVAMVAYHLLSTVKFLQTPDLHQDTHLGFALVLVYLASLRKSRKIWPLTLAFVLFSLITTGYIWIFYEDLAWRAGSPTTIDIIIGITLYVIVLEATRRAYGLILPVISSLLILYGFLGHLLPRPFYHFPYSVGRIVTAMDMGFQGMFGTFLNASANYIFLFVVFGAILQISGALEFFIEFGKLLGRKMKGGVAQTAVVSSALVGMVTGSQMANVALTGSFTIPAMKKVGYAPHQAGAIEAAASSGGQIMPPVMGATAFLMAAIIGVPYAKIMVVAAVPALLYYLGVGIYTELRARQMNLPPQHIDLNVKEMLLRGPLFFIPIILIIVILIMGFTPMRAASIAIATLVILSLVRKETRSSFRGWVDGISRGATEGSNIAMAVALLGPVVSVLSLTGLGITISHLVEAWSGGVALVALLLVMIISILLGCGLPTLGAYALVAIVTAPALVRMGVDLLGAHFFCFYFAIFSGLTPPVASAALVACRIAGGSYMKTAWESMKVGAVAFIVPWIFVYNSSLLNFSEPMISLFTIISVLLGSAALIGAAIGHYIVRANILERIALAVCGIAFVCYGITINVVFLITGLVLFAIVTFVQWRRRRGAKEVTELGRNSKRGGSNIVYSG